MENLKVITANNGLKLAYKFCQANDPVVVFLPGYMSDMNGTKALMLDEFCKELGQSYLRFDYSGHGSSEGEFINGTIGHWTDDACTVIKQVVGNKNIILVGSSMGGWIMLLSALRLKNQVKGMLGIAVAPDFTEELTWQNLDDEQKTKLEHEGVLYFPSQYDEQPYPVTYNAILDGRKQLLLNKPIEIDCPVNLVHGLEDKDVPWLYSVRTMTKLTSNDVNLQLIKHADHRLSSPEQLKTIQENLLDLMMRI